MISEEEFKSYGTLGITHHATEGLSVMRAIPELRIFSPADPHEAVAVTLVAHKIDTPCYIRLSKGRDVFIHKQKIDGYKIGKAIKILDGTDCAIFSTGAISTEALKAAEQLNDAEISTAFFTFPTIKPIDVEVIENYARQCKVIVTVEENNIIGGFGSAVAEVISEMKGSKAQLKKIGLRDEFTDVVGSQDYLRAYYKLTAENIFKAVTES
ncbi:MAG: hypothetical protein IKT98_04125 [Selenomonadaceae bacterium]|nr:hypothetical protein [Selenomonadaceae bacterium]